MFHSDRCRAANFRLGLALADLPSVRVLRDLLKEHAPASAYGYRLGLLRADRSVWYYPAGERKTPRWDGSHSRRGYFRIQPFEPPVLPGPALYGVQLLTREGAVLDVPEGFYGGVFVDPGHVLPADLGECV